MLRIFLVESCISNSLLLIYSINLSSRCGVSGSGKIAMHVLEKLVAYGAVPITVSGNFLFVVNIVEV